MALAHAQSGQVVSVLPLAAALPAARTTAILKAEQLEVVRIVLHAGQSFREHRVAGEITVLCIEGQIEFSTPAGVHLLTPGDFIHLQRDEAHALHAVTDASALLTICIAAAAHAPSP